MASLVGPNLKITRALEHLNALEAELEPLLHGHLYSISNYVNLKTREQIWQLDNDPPVIPDIISLLLGDCLYNFRAALDHLVWQLVLLNGNVPGERHEFPIFASPVKYKMGKQSRLKGLSQPAIAIIDGLQPNHAENWALSMLSELSNTDKHRHLHVTISALIIQQLSITRRTDGIGDVFLSSSQTNQGAAGHFGPIKKGTILYSTRNTQVEVKMNPIFDIIFSDFETESRVSVRDAMRSIREMVNKVFFQLSPLFKTGDTSKE